MTEYSRAIPTTARPPMVEKGRDPETILERTVERYLVKMVMAHGGRCPKLDGAAAPGIPDRLVLLPNGWMAFVEVKRPVGGRLGPKQKEWQSWCHWATVPHFIAKNESDVWHIIDTGMSAGLKTNRPE